MFYYVYVLENKLDEELYIGYTNNLGRRLKEHNQGENFSTKKQGGWRCVYCEACLNIKDAERREKYLKTTQGYRLLKRRLKDYFYAKKQEKF